jgi:heat shock protein HslJ
MRKSYNDWLVRAIWLGVTAVGAALLTGCAAGSSVAPSTPLEGTNWAMLSYIDANGQMKNALPDVQVTAIFKDGRVGGSDGCNRYFASYEVNGSQIKIGQAGSTMMACSPEEIMIQAAAFQAALASASSFRIENEQLTLMNAQGQAVLVFKAGAKTEGLALRSAPAGKIIGFLPEGAPVLILYHRTRVDGIEWIEVQDLVGRTGWVLGRFLAIRP